ncbi:hypothetical protein FI667_g14216, partial [Globisporangium splendens]
MLNNPLRSGQWNPDDNSDSDNDTHKTKTRAAEDGDIEGYSEDGDDDDGENIEDVELQLSPRSLQAFRASFGPKMRRRGLDGSGLAPSLCHFGLAATATSHLLNVSSSKRNLTHGVTGLALYGESQVPESCGGEIVLSSEAEGYMQQKWTAFFNHAETTLFSPLKQELEGREEAQRREQEKQSRLMKKRQDQQAQDTLRLQQSRRESAVLIATNAAGAEENVSPNAAESANFRLRRMTRESCQELQNELQYGVTTHGECKAAGNTQYFFFEYSPDVDGSILTLKLCVECGEAEVFMSTATKAPCVSDFMWRSVETSEGLDEGDGQKLVCTRTNSPKSSQLRLLRIELTEAMLRKANKRFHSTSLWWQSRQIQDLPYHLIARFNQLAKSFKGRTTASFRSPEPPETQLSSPRRLSQGVSAKTATSVHQFGADLDPVPFEGSEMRDRSATSSNHRQSRRKITSFESYQHEALHEGSPRENQYDEENGAEDMDNAEANSVGNGEDVRLFQHLLESISEKRGHGAARSKSFFLTGPTSDQFEFVQDERAKLTETALQLSPNRTKLTQPSNESNGVPFQTSEQDVLTMVADRHLSVKTSKLLNKIRRGASGRLLQRLSPLKSGVPGQEVGLPGGKLVAGPTLRVAKFTPQPVAYSLSALDRNAHHSGSAALLPQRKPALPQVQSASALASKSHVKQSPL